MDSLESYTRPLSQSERRLLNSRITALDADIRRGSKAVLPGLAIITLLWILTLAVSDVPWMIITGFWIAVGGLILLWVRHDMKKHVRVLAEMKRGLESALKRGEASVYDIRSRTFATFEELEDEGACYAFEIEGPRVVFVCGQEFYESSRFPSLDFSLVYILEENDQAVDMVVEKRGPKAQPNHVISARSKFEHGIPEHLETHEGPLDEVIKAY